MSMSFYLNMAATSEQFNNLQLSRSPVQNCVALPTKGSPVSSSDVEGDMQQGISSPFLDELDYVKTFNDSECPHCGRPYRQPRVLHCLHVLCEKCIEELLDHGGRRSTASSSSGLGSGLGVVGGDHELLEHNGSLNANFDSRLPVMPGSVRCPVCQQDTHVGSDTNAIRLLLPDYITEALQEAAAVEANKINCNSCKEKLSAIARCQDCANFLCPNCVTAHQLMRCFENHKVITFEEMRNNGNQTLSIHKPVMCLQHPTENMRYFCITCQFLVCNECMVSTHKPPDHQHERLGEDQVNRARNDLQTFLEHSKAKVEYCAKSEVELDRQKQEIITCVEACQQAIVDSFDECSQILANVRQRAEERLEELHKKHEEKLEECIAQLTSYSVRVQDACRFAERLLTHGHAMELLAFKRLVQGHLSHICQSMPATKCSVDLHFVSDSTLFEKAAYNTFGTFQNMGLANSQSNLEQLIAQIQYNSPGLVNEHHHTNCFNDLTVSTSSEKSAYSVRSNYDKPNTLLPTSNDMVAQAKAGYNANDVVSMNVMQMAQQMIANNQTYPGVYVNKDPSHIQPRFEFPSSNPVSQFQLSPSQMSTVSASSNPYDMAASYLAANMLRASAHPPLSPSPPVPGLSLTQPPPSNFNAFANAPSLNPPVRQAKMEPMQIRCKFGSLGPAKGQFNSPHGFCLGVEDDIVVADTNNHRIQIFDKQGEFKNQFGVPGKEEGQLWYPRKVAVVRKTGQFIVCDRGSERSRMQVFSATGHFEKKIAIRYIDIVAGLAVHESGKIVTVDSVAPTIFIVNDEGTMVHWFDCSSYMREPSDLAVSGGEFFVCDFKGHCVVVFSEKGEFLRRIGCENITNFPNGIDISSCGDILVGDSHGNKFHIAVFRRDGQLLTEFDCPYVKVSRCCGLRITREGLVVTLAKNNHHVLVLNTLYLTNNALSAVATPALTQAPPSTGATSSPVLFQ